jgi:hypothetical protein
MYRIMPIKPFRLKTSHRAHSRIVTFGGLVLDSGVNSGVST